MISPCLCTEYQQWQSNKLKAFYNWKAYRKNERIQRMTWSCVYASKFLVKLFYPPLLPTVVVVLVIVVLLLAVAAAEF
jgi:hypothetical protein